jgi:hypothetical protein
MRKRKRTYKKRKITGGFWPFSSNKPNDDFKTVVPDQNDIGSGNSPSSSFDNFTQQSPDTSMEDQGNDSKTQQIQTDAQSNIKKKVQNALILAKKARERRNSDSSKHDRNTNVKNGQNFFGGGKTKKNKHKKSKRKRKN